MNNNQLIGGGNNGPITAENPKKKANVSKNPIQITWENVVITAEPPKGRFKPKNAITEPRQIIKGVSGTVKPGQFLAIIGASG